MRRYGRGDKFIALLKRYGYTPKRLAAELRVCRGTVSHWGTGRRRLTDDRIREIASLLGCKTEEVEACGVRYGS